MPDGVQPDKFEFSLNIRDLDEEVLPNSPKDWLNTKVTYKTDSTYKALRRSLTLPIKFVLKAAFLLRTEFYTNGVLGRVDYSIKKLIPETYERETIYTGKLDFSKASDGLSDITIDAISKDFTVQLDAYGDKQYALPMVGTDIVDVTLPPLNLQETASFIIAGRGHFNDNQFPELDLIDNKQVASLPSVQNVPYGQLEAPPFNLVPNWFFWARADTKIFFDFSVSFNVSGPGTHTIGIYDQTGALIKQLFTVTDPAGDDPTDISNMQFVLNVANGTQLFIYCAGPHSGGGFNFQSGKFNIQYFTSTPSTKCLAIRAYDVFQRLLQAMNIVDINEPAQPVPNQSFLLNNALAGPLGRLVYTCSDTIRAFFIDENGNPSNTVVGALYQPGDTLQAYGRYVVLGTDDVGNTDDVSIVYNSKTYTPGQVFDWVMGQDTFASPDGDGFVRQIKSTPVMLISFKDFFQDILSLQFGQAGFGIRSGKVYLEDLSFFLQANTGLMDVGEVDKTTTITAAADMMFNSIKGGYKDQQYDAINGYNEVNSEVIYLTDITSTTKQADFQAVSRADPYGIEITRVTPLDTSSSRSDNNNFMLMLQAVPLEDGSYKPSQMDDCASFAGVDVSYYNWEITPKRNLLRGSQYLRSIFSNMDGYAIRVSAQKKNIALVTVDNSGKQVNEAADEIVSKAFGPKLFLPYYATVKAAYPVDALDIMDNYPFSDVAFTWNASQYRGFPVEMSIDTGANSAQTLKLLLSPSNNLLNLVH